ncbi:MAG: OmpA family protein [Myxococcota bacterium]
MVRIAALFLVLAACHKKTPIETVEMEKVAAPVADDHSDEAHDAAVKQMMAAFQRVHFEFDSSTLTAASKEALLENAKIMQLHPRISIQVQGHADERGTTDYNLALGQRRATAVQEQLALLGVSKSRVKLISLGEEQPLAAGHNEVAWSQNRRCEFHIMVGEEGVSGTTAAR